MSDFGTTVAECVGLALVGDEDAYLRLVTRYKGIVAATVYSVVPNRTVVEDLTEDAFAEAWRKLGTLRNASLFGPWVRRIAHRLALSYVRREAHARTPRTTGAGGLADGPASDGRPRGSQAIPPLEHLPAGPESDPTRVIARQDLYERVALEISRLPWEYQDALGLRYFEGHSCKEIAARLGLPIGTVTMQLSRGTRMLRERLNVALEGYLEGRR